MLSLTLLADTFHPIHGAAKDIQQAGMPTSFGEIKEADNVRRNGKLALQMVTVILQGGLQSVLKQMFSI